MKKFFKFAAVAAIAAMFASCTEKPGPEPDDPKDPETPKVEITENLAFTLEVTEVEADQAKIKVEHNGTTKDSWYGFVTTESDVNAAIAAKVTELTADGGKISGLKKNRSTTVTVRNLEPETDYAYVVFGMTAEGELYGTANSVKFETAKGEVVMTVNPAWKVEYTGAGVIYEQEYEHTITVTSTDNNKYFITGLSKEYFEQNDLKAIAEEELAYVKAYIDQFNQQNGTNYTIDAMLFDGSGVDALMLDPGEWYAMAIGVGPDGELSGLYAISEVITIAEEEMSEAYAAWLGDWTFTGANGAAYNVTFAKGVSNQSYQMTGWQDMTQIPVEVTWLAEDGIWVIYPQSFGTYTIDNEGTEGDIYFLGAQETEQGYTMYTDAPVCLGGPTENGLISIGYSDEENGIDMQLMSYFVVIGGTPYFWDSIDLCPSFPITITPATEAASTRSVEKEYKSVAKFTQTPRVFKGLSTNFVAL